MLNTTIASLALVASMAFYFVLEDAVESMQPEYVDVWHCDGWAGVKYKNERDMRKAVIRNEY